MSGSSVWQNKIKYSRNITTLNDDFKKRLKEENWRTDKVEVGEKQVLVKSPSRSESEKAKVKVKKRRKEENRR
ncbi:hypothetical protein RhiirA5_446851 [Rhizophagus irregularis]|uniref:Uncharacterized protein n=1 Tax=Rhizophagus irregularis TaxID=588596 RepID=A0A2I1FRQ7_9GLOM|nr:hypothetical protein RhiirA5_446851 [Rhizophagus irregularis]PKC50391.1 hypothetical protein RhiirA1_486483 [Rhizophagus irregularis]PKY37057.1 hypothetical protein RhiirB3_461197 [Rhizophagus irregularis]